jgi:hypothetical protein
MKYLIGEFPTLCTALIGEWCCDGGAAQAQVESVGVNCSASPSPFGLFHLSGDSEQCAKYDDVAAADVSGCDDVAIDSEEDCVAAGHGWAPVAFETYNATETGKLLSSFIGEDPVGMHKCALVNHVGTGFMRSESLFAEFGRILDETPMVTVVSSCAVTDLRASTNGRITVVSATTGGSDACAAGVPNEKAFDRVVVAAGAATVPLLSTVDPDLKFYLTGIKGFGVAGTAGDGSPTVPADGDNASVASQRGRAIHLLDSAGRFEAAFGRAQATGKVKIWGGHDVELKDSFSANWPPYDFASASEEARIFKESGAPEIARTLASLDTTVKQTGMRPVSYTGQVPLLKRYKHKMKNLFVHTGGGYNGYDVSWFGSSCIVEWLHKDTFANSTAVFKACDKATTVGAENTKLTAIEIALIVGVSIAGVCVLCTVAMVIRHYCKKDETSG